MFDLIGIDAVDARVDAMSLFAMLPPMPFGPAVLWGLVGTILAGLLNLYFRGARWRWADFCLAAAISPLVILLAWRLGMRSSQPVDYVFIGALVGILCVRGSRSPGPIPGLLRRSVIVFAAVALLGPAVAMLFHFSVERGIDVWDPDVIRLSLLAGLLASVAGWILAAVMVCLALLSQRGR